MPAAGSVIRVQPVLATRHLGLRVGEARFSDGLIARFRVLSRDPIGVHVLGDEATHAHERALVAWLAKQRELLQKGGLAEHLGKMPLGRTGYPDDLAKAVLFMASDLASYVSGTSLTVDGAQTLR